MFITLNYKSRMSLCDQLCESIIRLAACGAIAPGEQIPSVRSLAQELGINPNTVQKAYRQLEQNGVIETVPGKGSFLSRQNQAREQLRQSALDALAQALDTALNRGVSVRETAEFCAAYLSKKEEPSRD